MILRIMSKLKKGYFVKGKFVAEGSELDLEFKRELKALTIAPALTSSAKVPSYKNSVKIC